MSAIRLLICFSIILPFCGQDLQAAERVGGTNAPPDVNAGEDQTINLGTQASLDATISDDGSIAPLIITWTGPTQVTFLDAHAEDTTASFSEAGVYELTVTADDGELQTSDTITIKVIDCEIAAGDFRTQTQGGWGTTAHGGNPGSYRDAHFETAFPSGVTLGADALGIEGFSATFTSSAAVEAFLPQGRTPGAFTQDYVDPTATSAGVLAGQVLALELSVGFDLSDPDFGASDTALGELVVVAPGSPCLGKTVQEVLDEAHKILAGAASDFTASQINDCVTNINENFVDGTEVGTYLALPGCEGSSSAALTDQEWEEARNALREKAGELYQKLLKIFDEDGDGSIDRLERRAFRMARRAHASSLRAGN